MTIKPSLHFLNLVPCAMGPMTPAGGSSRGMLPRPQVPRAAAPAHAAMAAWQCGVLEMSSSLTDAVIHKSTPHSAHEEGSQAAL